MIDYRKVKTVVWTPEQIANHLKAIGAEHPPKPPDKLQKTGYISNSITTTAGITNVEVSSSWKSKESVC